MKIPSEWLNPDEILSAADVRKMNPGEYVWYHRCYGKLGEHVYCKAKIVQYGKKKRLEMRDWQNMPVYKDIKDAENIAYTRVTECEKY